LQRHPRIVWRGWRRRRQEIRYTAGPSWVLLL